MAYLGIRSNHFYSIRTEVEGRHFVTARGWEDLSRTIQVYEKRRLPVNEGLAVQFLQDPEIARSFSAYYDLYVKYQDIYRVPDILEGRFFPGGETEGTSGAEGGAAEAIDIDPVRIQEMQDAPFDEKLSLISLLIDALGKLFLECAREKKLQEMLLRELGQVRSVLKNAGAQDSYDKDSRYLAADTIRDMSGRIRRGLQSKKDAGIPVSRGEERTQRRTCKALDELERKGHVR